MEGEDKRRMRDHDDARVRNFELARLIGFAYHDPGNMPKFEATEAESEPANDLADQERVRGFFIAAALSSGKK